MLREGRVNRAIAAYVEVLEARPDDWPAANRLGDLYMQTGKTKEAVEQFLHVAQQLFDRDLLPKAAALFKKVLKIVPEDEHARMQLAEIAERQGFLVDAKTHLTALAEQRRRAGDDQGAKEVERRIAGLGSTGTNDTATTTGPTLPHLPDQSDKDEDSWEINKQMLFKQEPANGSPDSPADTRPTADAPRRIEEEAQLKLMLIENECRAARFRRAHVLIATLLSDVPESVHRVVDLAKQMIDEQAEATVMCAEAILEAGLQHDTWEASSAAVRQLAVWVPAQPQGHQWPPELLQRLARTDAAARLETMRRESAAILEAFPGLTVATDGHRNGRSDSAVIAPSQESAVAAAV